MRRAILFVVLFASFAFFYHAGGWNQNSRFDLTRALVEQHRVEIDSYHGNTGDKSVRDGHYYADKAPGASLAAVPAVALARAAIGWAGANPSSRESVVWLSYIATLAAASVPATLGGLALFALARRFGAGANDAALVTLVCALGTPFWAYASLMWGHAMAGAALLGAALAADRLRDPSPGPWADARLGAGVGFACGWAVCTEYPAAVPAVIFAALAIGTAWQTNAGRARQVAIPLAAAALLCAVLLMTYQAAAFGSPFRIGYESLEERSLMSAGFFGITWPKPAVMSALLFGSYRGLLPLAPVLALAPIGAWRARRSPMRWTLAAGCGVFLFYFLMNAAYQHWEGGWSYGPRHLGPALPFLCLALTPLITRASAPLRLVVMALAAVGAANALAAVATTPQPPSETLLTPMTDLIWPQFLDGHLATNLQSVFDALWPSGAAPAAWNWGQKAGLHGLVSLLPLLLVYVMAAVAWRRTAR